MLLRARELAELDELPPLSQAFDDAIDASFTVLTAQHPRELEAAAAALEESAAVTLVWLDRVSAIRRRAGALREATSPIEGVELRAVSGSRRALPRM